MNTTTTDTVEDVEFLFATGETPERVARRVGYQPASLERLLHRAGRHDLARRIHPANTTRKKATQ